MILRAEIDWVEDCLFVLYLLISVFYYNICFALILKNILKLDSNYQILILSVLLSSGLSFNATNLYADFYRNFIKTKYNTYCSPQLREIDKDSLTWTLLKNLSITYLPITSLLLTIFMRWFVQQHTDDQKRLGLSGLLQIHILSDKSTNETLFLVLFFTASLVLSLTLWLMLSAFIKYILLSTVITTQEISFESLVQHTNTTDDTLSHGSVIESTG